MNLYCVFYSILFYSNSTLYRFMYKNILLLRRTRKIKCQHRKRYNKEKVFAAIIVLLYAFGKYIHRQTQQ